MIETIDRHEHLVRGRNVLDRDGWVQCAIGDPCAGYCVAGALMCALHDMENPAGNIFVTPAYQALNEAAWKLGAQGRRGAVDYNDTPGRTKEEVLALYDAAIAATAPEPKLEEPHLELVAEPVVELVA